VSWILLNKSSDHGRVNLIAAVWGFAEATLFFIVPDVWLSIAGRKKLKIGLLACLYSLIGALIGGIILYFWGYNDLVSASKIIEKVPAVSHEMLLRAHSDMSEQGVWAVMLGPLSGTPFKVYAIQAADAGFSLWLFVLISIPARLIRFIFVTIFCHFSLKILSKVIKKLDTLMILVSGWVIFYSYYFYVMAW
jgi:membrane protein YqaA with SNARE-associated domain